MELISGITSEDDTAAWGSDVRASFLMMLTVSGTVHKSAHDPHVDRNSPQQKL